MAMYADIICKQPLYKHLDKCVGRDELDGGDIDRLKGMVSDVADQIGPVLKLISETFSQYTEHDIRHSKNVIFLMWKLIPKRTRDSLSGLEVAMLLLAGLLHDVGMVVSLDEKSEALAGESFQRFRDEHPDRLKAIDAYREKDDELRARAIEDSLLADYFRRFHPDRASAYVKAKLARRLTFQEVDLSQDVADLCASHGWGMRESWNPLEPDQAVCKLLTDGPIGGVPCNMQYLACLLRMADILDFDRSRTPVRVYEHIEFTDNISCKEWNKHLSIRGWTVKPRQICYRASCEKPAFYVAVQEFLDQVEEQLRECHYLVDRFPADQAERCTLTVPHAVDRSQVKMADPSVLAGAFKFSLEYDKILQLLMDKSLYPDPSLFLRELLQNSLDACRHKAAVMAGLGRESQYIPRISVWDHSTDPDNPHIIFQDNGIGMDQRIVENYFLRVGRSYYRSDEFKGVRARLKRTKDLDIEACSYFGIGILSCFMVADRFDVLTRRDDSEPLEITVEGPEEYFMIKRQSPPDTPGLTPKPTGDHDDGPPVHAGTRVTVYLKGKRTFDTYETLNTFACNVDYDIRVYPLGRKRPRVIKKRRWDGQDLDVSNFSMVIGPSLWASEAPRFTEAPAGILVPSRIPFGKWDFSKDILGSACFWLLPDGDGGVCWQRGWLRVGRGLQVRPPEAISNIADVCGLLRNHWWSSRPGELIEIVLSYLRDPYSAPDLGSFWDSDDRELMELLDGIGTNVKDTLRFLEDGTIFDTILALHERSLSGSSPARHGRRDEWYKHAAIVRRLLSGSAESLAEMCYSCTVNGRRQLGYVDGQSGKSDGSRLLALHGVLTPGGVASWDPAAAEVTWMQLLPVLGIALIDARGALAPVPSASRLSVAYSDAAPVLIPYQRALVRHALDIGTAYYTDEAFRNWFCCLALGDGALEEGDPRLVAVRHDLDLIEERIPYAFYIDGERRFLSRNEIISQFSGPWMAARRHKHDSAPHFDCSDSLTNELLALRRCRGPYDESPWEPFEVYMGDLSEYEPE